MKIKENGRKSAGYSLVEVLVTTAVLVILMALTFVAIFAYKKRLDITELDNAAREIYMAAQNRAVLLKNRDRLEELVEKENTENPGNYTNQLKAPDGSTEEYYYYVSKNDIEKMEDQELLPAESIESSLWSGDFYIVYEPESGSVTDVFYMEKEFSEGEFDLDFYNKYREKSREERMDLTPMVGYYGGESSVTGDTYTPRTPMLRIINDNELTVEVTCWLPEELQGEADKVQLLLNLQYGDQSIDLCRVTLSGYNEHPAFTTKPSDGDVDFALENSDSPSKVPYRFASKPGEPDKDNTDLDHDYYKYVCTYVLDSLDGRQFKDLGFFTSDGKWTTSLGRDFTVTAEIEYKGSSRLINAAKRTATDNSLFAASSLGNTAHIACMRHLQNLDKGFSDVDKNEKIEESEQASDDVKYFAIQIADIDNIEVNGAMYNFTPIDNSNILLYDGNGHRIYELYIDSQEESFAVLGLFSYFAPSDVNTDDFFNEEPVYKDRGLRNIQLVNTYICCDASLAYVGALCAFANNAEIVNCSVYWIPDEKTSIQQKLGTTSYDMDYILSENKYKVEAKGINAFVGGLIASYTGSEKGRISDCFVATTVNSGHIAGGLVGWADNVRIENSYTDCYIHAKKAAGIVGTSDNKNGYEVINCFATGYISVDSEDGSKSAGLGLLGGDSNDGIKINVKNSYAAIAYNKPDSADLEEEKGEIQNRYPLVPVGDDVNIENSYYLYSPYVNNDLYPEWIASFDQLSDGSVGGAAQNLYAVKTETGESVFAKKPSSPDVSGTYYSHPYNLQDGIELENYPFPAFGDSMPQYGDWPEAKQKGYLVYWEKYNDAENSIGVEGADGEASELSGLPKLKAATDTNALVVDDGYAVYLPSELVPTGADTITIRFERTTDAPGNEVAEMTYGVNLTPETDSQASLIQVTSGDTIYYLAPLPKKWVSPDSVESVASSDFYQKLHITVENSTNPTTYFFNPHFASTVIKADYAAEEPTLTSANITASVRSPRHLYELSRHPQYYHNSVANQYTYNQELDLDYSVYKGYGLFTLTGGTAQQEPIGKEGSDSTFNQIYDGGCHTIVKVPLQTSGRDVGLFGSNAGTIQDVVFLGNGVIIDRETPDPDLMVITRTVTGSDPLNIGTLVGHNAGRITNCAVAYVAISIEANGTEEVNCGGLVGKNDGTILNSAATLDYIEVTGNGSGSKCVGGFVGSNTATITSCYAIGRMNVAEGTIGINVGGFAGANSGTLQSSYTAYDLTSYEDSSAFCPGGTGDNVKNCYYLNGGSFTYLNKDVFRANYPAGAGISQTWTDLTAVDGTVVLLNGTDNIFGMHGAKYRPSDENVEYVFPAVVRDAAENLVHYGDWPEKVKDGLVGLFYWEKEVKQSGESGESGDEGEYHVSAIIINPNESTVRKVSNLCNEHSDGGVIKEYGYGYFYDNNLSGTVTCAVDNLGINSVTKEVKSLADVPSQFMASSDLIKASFKNAANDPDIDGSDYVFNAYQTIDMDLSKTNAERHLMYLINGATSSTWKLEVNANATDETGKKSYQFNVNPFFGESLSLATTGETDGLKDDTGFGVPRGELGTNSIPFETRSVEQLQYINWNWQEKQTNVAVKSIVIGTGLLGGTDVAEESNCKEFTFLSCSSPIKGTGDSLVRYELGDKQFFWKQSHDLCGNGEYTPIAAFNDSTIGSYLIERTYLAAWFGGEYDGANYDIQNLNIAANDSNCVGLFGVAMNATLKNIVMSVTEEGKGTVTGDCGFIDRRENWYALGGLVGLAASCNLGGTPTATTIDNCAIAGYKIEDNHTSIPAGTVGGVGGLVGMGNAEITGCSAVTEIQINSTFSAPFIFSTNVYVGGIAGTSQQSIEYCYAGGSIVLNKNFELGSVSGLFGALITNNLTMGGLQGSGSAKTLNVGTSTGNTPVIQANDYWNQNQYKGSISYSYSYVTLPDALTGDDNSGLTRYAIGDASEYRSCYYLESAVPDDVDNEEQRGGNVRSCTYGALSGKDSNDILSGLNSNSATDRRSFEYLTNDNGVHSYPTSAHLENMDYPFPAILTGAAEGTGTPHVHYGDWPLDGIIRDDGGTPIALDMLADYKAPDTGATTEPERSGGAFEKITLSLSSLLQQSLSAGSAGSDPLGKLTVKVEPVEAAGGEGESGGSTGETTGGAGGTEGSAGGSEGGTSGTDVAVVEAYFLDEAGNRSESPIELTSGNLNDKFTLVILAKNPGSVNVIVECQKPAAAGEEGEVISTLTIPVTVTAVVSLLPAQKDAGAGGSWIATKEPQVILVGADAASGAGAGAEEIVSTIALYPFDKYGKPLPENLLSQIRLGGSGEIAPAVAAASLNEIPLNTISANAAIRNEEMSAALERADGTDYFELKVSGKMDGLTPGTSSIKVSYSYTYLNKTYKAESEIPVSVKKAQLTAAPANIVLESVDVSGGDVLPSAKSVSYETGSLHLTLGDASEAVTDLHIHIVGVESVKVELETAGSGTTEPGTTESENTGSGTCVKAEPQADGTLMLTPQKCGTETLKLVVEFTYGGNKYRMSTDLVVTVSAAVQAANLEVSGGDLLISGEVSGGDPLASGLSALANVFKSEPTVRKPVDGVRCDEDGLLPSPFKSAQDVSDGDLQ